MIKDDTEEEDTRMSYEESMLCDALTNSKNDKQSFLGEEGIEALSLFLFLFLLFPFLFLSLINNLFLVRKESRLYPFFFFFSSFFLFFSSP
jgi:hypothetical protein